MTSVTEQIARWFTIAKPEPTIKDLNTQIGVHIEEFGEMIDALEVEGEANKLALQQFHKTIVFIADSFKKGTIKLDHDLIDRVCLLDSICDQVVTGIGIAVYDNLDIENALKEVANSNDSKFVDGKAVLNENGKIIKGPNYVKPNLVNYV